MMVGTKFSLISRISQKELMEQTMLKLYEFKSMQTAGLEEFTSLINYTLRKTCPKNSGSLFQYNFLLNISHFSRTKKTFRTQLEREISERQFKFHFVIFKIF